MPVLLQESPLLVSGPSGNSHFRTSLTYLDCQMGGTCLGEANVAALPRNDKFLGYTKLTT